MPDKVEDVIGKALIWNELQEFKKLYGVEHSSRLRCPACNQYGQTGGSLWGPSSGKGEIQLGAYICRKCKLVWLLECLTKPIAEVIEGIKKASKSEGE